MSMPEPLRIALADKQAQDSARMLDLASRLDGKEASNGAEAIRLAMATPSTVDRSEALPMSIANASRRAAAGRVCRDGAGAHATPGAPAGAGRSRNSAGGASRTARPNDGGARPFAGRPGLPAIA